MDYYLNDLVNNNSIDDILNNQYITNLIINHYDLDFICTKSYNHNNIMVLE